MRGVLPSFGVGVFGSALSELRATLSMFPTLALACMVVQHLVDRVKEGRQLGWASIIGTFDESAGSVPSGQESSAYVIVERKQLVVLLQIIVGSLVTFGGTAYVVFASNSLGTLFGSGHLLVGLVGLSVGIIAAGKKVLPRRQVLGVNVLTIVYSLASDGAAGVLSLLPIGAFHDSIIGTAAAVIMSGAIIYLLSKP